MTNLKNKLPLGIAVIFGITVLVTGIVNLIFRQWKNLFLALLALVCLTFPFIIAKVANKKKLVLPSNFVLSGLVFIFSAQYLGEIVGFYRKFFWWDLFLHAVFGVYAVIVGLHLVEGIIKKEDNITEKRFIFFTVIFAFTFTITLGTLWEIFEYAGDHIFKTQMVKGGADDTAEDLIAKIIAAFITSLIYYFRKLSSRISIMGS